MSGGLTLEQKKALLIKQMQAKTQQAGGDSAEVAMYLRDSRLDPELAIASTKAPHPAKELLVTGVTGYVAAFLAHALALPGVRLHCLVRATDAAAGMARLRTSLQRYNLWQERFEACFVPVLGDLSQRRLGLDEATYDQLTGTIDAVFHVGAHVNFAVPYEGLRPTNVQGTLEMIRFAGRQRSKPLHFVSSLGMFLSSAYGGKTIDAATRADPMLTSSGYGSSKAVAESLLLQARERGLPVIIYRAGFVAWDSKSGLYNEADLACQVLLGCVQLGAAPAVDFTFNALIPIDYVVDTMVQLAAKPWDPKAPAVVPLANPRRTEWRTVLEELDTLGWRVRAQPYSQWRAGLAAASNNVLAPMVPLMPDQGHVLRDITPIYTPFSAADAPVCPPLDRDLMRPFVALLQERGLLPK